MRNGQQKTLWFSLTAIGRLEELVKFTGAKQSFIINTLLEVLPPETVLELIKTKMKKDGRWKVRRKP